MRQTGYSSQDIKAYHPASFCCQHYSYQIKSVVFYIVLVLILKPQSVSLLTIRTRRIGPEVKKSEDFSAKIAGQVNAAICLPRPKLITKKIKK